MADTVIASGANASMDDLPLWLQATGGDAALNYSAITDRTLIDALYASEGVLGAASFAVTQRAAGANFSVDIAAGYGVIQGDSIANQGKYLIRSVGVVNATTPSAPASGTRIHRVIARVRDKGASGTNYDWTFEVLEDTGSGTPAVPPSAIHVALVSIASGQASVLNANITSPATHAVPYRGGPYRQDVILSGTAASVVISGLPTGLRSLRIKVSARGDAPQIVQPLYMRINGDSGGNYFGIRNTITNATAAITNYATQGVATVGTITGSNAGGNHFGEAVIDLAGWNRSDRPLNFQYQSITYPIAANSTSETGGGVYNISATFTSITLLPFAGNFAAGSEFHLEGWD